MPLEFMVPSLRIAVDHDLDYNAILRARLEKLMTLDEQRQRAVWCQQIVQNRKKTWHDKHIKHREYKKGDLVLLYQSRMGPKKPNLTIAWAGPYQIDWVYTNGSVKLVDLQGLALPGYYNASKIKHYEYVHDQVSTPDKSATDDEVNLNHTMFDEPTVGSVKLIDDYDQLWAEVLDETTQSVSGESMMTAQPGWDSEQEERDSFVKDKIHGENMQAKDFLQVPACTKLGDEVPGTINECTVPGNMEGCKAGDEEAGKQGEEGSHMSVDGMKKGKITGKGSNYFTWLNFKFNQCMSATWINGTPSGALNTLKTRDLTENCFMMGKSPRDTHDTKRPTLHGKNPKAKSLVSTPLIPKLSSLCTDTQKELTSIPLLSSSPSLTESSPSSQHNTINPLKLFSAIDIALDNLSLHHKGKGGTEDSSASFLSSASFPSLSKLSIPTSPVSQHLPEVLFPLAEDSASQAMDTTGEHTGGSSHTEHGGSTGGINLNWAPVPTIGLQQSKPLLGSWV